MSYAVLHMQKLKQPAIKGIQIHNQREKESKTNGDIDEARSHLNYDLLNPNPADYNEKINGMIKEGVTTGKAIRKDAVKVASFLVTSDAEFFKSLSPQEEKRFFESAYEFFAEEYGEKNLAYAMVHKDEKTPHMHVGFVPITADGRLSAKDFFGKKHQLVQLQDKFHNHMVQEGFDLDRGVSSDRKHVESAKYKALTFQEMENEAKEKYEQTIGHIQQIEEKSQAIANIESKKVLGLVGMKEKDYKTLVNYATNGAVYQSQVADLERELSKSKAEVIQLKSDIQTGQDKVRHFYKDVDVAAEKKALEKLNRMDIVKNYSSLLEKNKRLVGKYNEQLHEKEQLKQTVKDLTIENKTLKEKLVRISKEFSVFKERVEKVLHLQIDRVKRFLKVNNAEPGVIKSLDDRQDKLVQDSLEKLEKPIKERQNEMEL